MKLHASIMLFAFILCVPAHAAVVPDDSTRVIVKLSDLDLSHATGRAVLRQRVANGAAAFCAPAPKITNLDGARRYRACVREATERTLAATNRAMLAQGRETLALAGEH